MHAVLMARVGAAPTIGGRSPVRGTHFFVPRAMWLCIASCLPWTAGCGEAPTVEPTGTVWLIEPSRPQTLPPSGAPRRLTYSASVDPGFEGGGRGGVSDPIPAEEWISGWHATLSFAHHVNVWFVAPPLSVDTFCQSVGTFANQGRTFVLDAAKAQTDERVPAGGAIRVPAGSRYAFDVHTLNTSPEAATSEITVDLETAASSPLEVFPGILNAESFSVPPSSEAALTFSCEMSPRVQVVWMSTHSHRFTSSMAVQADGIEVYRSTNWQDPLVEIFGPPIMPAKVSWTSTIRNTLPTALSFGPSRDKNEMSGVYLMTLGAREWCIR